VGIRNIQGSYIAEKDIAPTLDRMLGERDFPNEGKHKFNMTVSDDSGQSTDVKKISVEDEFKNNFVEVVMTLLDQCQTSNDAVQKLVGVGYHKANEYMDKLEEYGLIPSLGSKRGPRKLFPEWFDNASSEVWELLEEYGYTMEDIENAFINRK
jgi:hypothetical protein